jgi:Universal stress protein family
MCSQSTRRCSRIHRRSTKHACSGTVEKTLGAVAHTAQAVGVACNTVHVEHEHPYQAIIDTAESKGSDLIVMASQGRHGISAIILGSESIAEPRGVGGAAATPSRLRKKVAILEKNGHEMSSAREFWSRQINGLQTCASQ